MSTMQAVEARARRAAKRVGLMARKSRYSLSIDNLGEFQLLDPFNNRIVAGENFDLTAEEVIEYCKTVRGTKGPGSYLGLSYARPNGRPTHSHHPRRRSRSPTPESNSTLVTGQQRRYTFATKPCCTCSLNLAVTAIDQLPLRTRQHSNWPNGRARTRDEERIVLVRTAQPRAKRRHHERKHRYSGC